ncbi:MAG: tetratricopeptide repeat protein [Chitinophagaceae bacterium]
MKKILVVALSLLLANSAFAQKSKMRDARDYLGDQNYKKALVAINEAVNNESTKDNAEAWYLRGMAYLQQAIDSTAHEPNAANESLKSLMKALALKPDYGPEINNGLYSNALLAFNDGVAEFSSNPAAAYDKFMKVVDIYNVGNGKRFANAKPFTELVVSAKSNGAYAALNAKEDDKALALLSELRSTGQKDSNMYQSLIEIYTRKNDDNNLLSTISEARKAFPNSALFRNLELNYYIRSGKTEVLANKLEEAVKADPNNGELWYNLANVYERSAFPKDDKGTPLAKPSDFNEVFSKAENAYAKALKASPNNPDYNYNFGVLYYETAADLTQQMNKITGMTAPEQKQYDGLMAQRDAQFAKAQPYFERAYNLLDPKASNLDQSEKITYQNAMIGLREIYSRQNNKAKTDELKGKLDALR